MVIRQYREGDYPHIRQLWEDTGIYRADRGDTPAVIRRCNDQGGAFLVMEEQPGGRIVGTSWMTYDGRRLHLHHFAIRPSHQGKGLGKILALESLKHARKKSCPVKLEVHDENKVAIHLYESLGFVAFENYHVYMILEP
ncbi:MAG TPA: GNAT family N-acetyltransferase [Bacteroides sp.]|nr:GNAT family N-acetyltransferase [Bacteroides sp.]